MKLTAARFTMRRALGAAALAGALCLSSLGLAPAWADEQAQQGFDAVPATAEQQGATFDDVDAGDGTVAGEDSGSAAPADGDTSADQPAADGTGTAADQTEGSDVADDQPADDTADSDKTADAADKTDAADESDSAGDADAAPAAQPKATLRFYVVTSQGKVAYASLAQALAATNACRSAEGAPLCVAVDAAHDSTHAGTAQGGLSEADLTLQLANQLAKLAQADGAYNVTLVRAGADALDAQASEADELAARMDAAKQAGANVVVELHVNLAGTDQLECALPAATDGVPVVAVEVALAADGTQAIDADQLSQLAQLDTLEQALCSFALTAPVSADAVAQIDAQASTAGSTASKFTDTPADAWYVTGGYLDYVVDAGLMNGYTDGTGRFDPEASITREQVVTVLYRYAGGSYSSNTTHFTDVATGQYYTAAVEWAYQNGITTGYTDGSGKFGVGDPITREQLCTMLSRFAARCGVSGGAASIAGYPDASNVSSWATDGVKWCVGQGIVSGDQSYSPARLNPQGNTRRCEAAKMFTVLVRDVLKGASFVEVSWKLDGVSASTSYILSAGSTKVSAKVSGSTSGLSYRYSYTGSNGYSWCSDWTGDSSFNFYLGGVGTYTITVTAKDSSGITRSESCTVTVWDLSATVSSDGGWWWTAYANIDGATSTSGFTYKYTWKQGQYEASATNLRTEWGASCNGIGLTSQDYYIVYVKAVDPEGHETYVRKTFLYAPSGKIGWQNPSWMYQVSSYSVSPHSYNRGVLSYMSSSRISADASRSDVVEAFIARAYEYLGTSYVWDYACAPGVGVDCVGLVMQCMYAVGMDTTDYYLSNDCFCPICHWDTGASGWHSHDANNLRNSSHIQLISKYDMQRGDLVFWNGHVAIYLGDGQIIQALPSGGVYQTSLYNSSSYNYYSIVAAGRIFAL